jgi:hypothetical protein
MNLRIFGALVVVALAAPARAQDFDIEGYCKDMAGANSLGTGWSQRCVANLEIQQKYMKQAEQRALGSSAIEQRIRKNNLIISYTHLLAAEEKSTGEEQKLVTARLDLLLAVECPAVFGPVECSGMRAERAELNHR